MIIKSHKDVYIYVVSFYVGAFLLFFSFSGHGILMPVIAFLFMLYYGTRLWVMYGRTYIMDENGCLIKFLWIRKFYRWDEFKIKRYENYSGTFSDGNSYYGAAVFSPHKVRRPKFLQFEGYIGAFRLRVFSCVFVQFKRPIKLEKLKYQYPDAYVVDEHIFKQKMDEWGIEIVE